MNELKCKILTVIVSYCKESYFSFKNKTYKCTFWLCSRSKRKKRKYEYAKYSYQRQLN